MGNQAHRANRNHSQVNQPNTSASRPVSSSHLKCPNCQLVMPEGATVQNFSEHIRSCLRAMQENQHVPQHIANHPLLNGSQSSQNTQYEKVPVDYTLTKFKWEKKPIKQINPAVLAMEASDVRKLSFQEKESWFRNKVEKKRIRWENGADFMKLERSNILMTSLVQHKKVNMNKEVKIEFIGEKVNDAGGLLREWIHMVVKEVFDDSTGIFQIADTEDIMYKLKWDDQLDEQFSCQLFQLFGTIVGKAIFQRIPIQSYMDRTILRHICGNPIKIQDIYGYDKELYKNWTYILKEENLDDLQMYFVIPRNTSDTVQEIQLIPNGSDVLVTNANKFQYVDLCIQTQTIEKVKRSINKIKKGVNRVIPEEYLTIFEPYELEMILYGIPFIDLKEWKDNTMYKSPYNQSHPIVMWFWKTMQNFDQDQLANMLHFCTGSSRTPIHGFKKLESNRGNYSKFLIQPTTFVKTNPFPKGHTCFNRLQLPTYPDESTLNTYVTAISKSNLDGVFGLD